MPVQRLNARWNEVGSDYPTHDDYVKKYTDAADAALAAGYLLQADHDEAVEQAKAASIPK